jgi:hypothetical protein
MRAMLVLFLGLLLSVSSLTAQYTYQSVASGQWNDPANWEVWDGGSYVPATYYPGDPDPMNPFPNPDVVIYQGHSIDFFIAGFIDVGILSLSGTSSELNFISGNLTIWNAVFIDGDANSINVSGGNFFVTNDTYIFPPTLSGQTNQIRVSSIGRFSTYFLYSFNSTADDMKCGILLDGGDFYVYDDINMGSNVNRNFITFTPNGGNLHIRGNFNSGGSFNSNNVGTTHYTRSGPQIVKAYTYHNLYFLSGGGISASKVLDGSTIVTGNLRIGDNNFANRAFLNMGTAAKTLTVHGSTTINTGSSLVFEGTDPKEVFLLGNLIGTNGIIDMTGGQAHKLYLSGASNTLTTFNNLISSQTEVHYNRAGNQTMFTSGNYSNLFIEGGGEKSLVGNVTTRTLTMTSGNINTGANLIEVGNSTGNIGELTHASGNIIGRLRRWNDGNPVNGLLYPLGTSGAANHATFDLVSGITAGSITGQFFPADPGDSGLPLIDSDDEARITEQFTDGYWSFLAENLFSCTDYIISLQAGGFSSFSINGGTRVIKRTNGGDWDTDGSHEDAVGILAKRSNLNGISSSGSGTQFALAISDPSIFTQPADAVSCDGQDASFSLTARGAGPFTYQWYLVGSPDAELTGKTSATLEFTPAGLGDAGEYYCVVTDKYGNTNSTNTVELTVHPLPAAPTGSDLTVTYDGTEHSASASVGAGETLVWYTAQTGGSVTTAPTATNAGTYTAWVAARDDVTLCESERTEVTLTINQRAITITVDAGQTKIYGEADPTPFTYQLTAGTLATGDAFDGELARAAGETIGNYAINQGTLFIVEGATDNTANYDITFQGADFTITERTITITVDPGQEKSYGDADPVLTYQITTGSLAAGDSFDGALARAAGEIVGNYAIGIGTLTIVEGATNKAANYNITFQGDDFTITQRSITLTVDPGQEKSYGDADPVLTYQITTGSLAAGDSFDGALARAAGEIVGNYAIGIGTLTIVEGATNKAANYDITFSGDDFSITQRPITITVDPGQTKIYGQSDPTPYTYQITTGSLAAGDAFDGTLARAAGEIVGNYTIGIGTLTIVEGAVDKSANYNITFQSADFAITQRAITITVDPGQTKTYGETDPTPFTWQLTTGTLAAGDAFDGELSRAGGETVGNYAIEIGSLTIVEAAVNKAANYDITFQSADFTITQRAITITVDPGQTKIYGEADPTPFTYQLTAGTLAAVDAFDGLLDRAVGEIVGNYAIDIGTLTIVEAAVDKSANYDITFQGADFTITERAISLTVDPGQTKIYGTPDPVFTYQVTAGSLGPDDSFSGLLARDPGETVGTYPINQGTLTIVEGAVNKAANYDITFQGDDFTISQRAITITVDPGQTKTYGNPDPVFTYQVTAGSLGPDDSFSGLLARDPGEIVGTYPINQGTLTIVEGAVDKAANYNITFQGADFTITQRAITITVDPGQSKTYGNPDPVFTYQVTAGSLGPDDSFSGLLERDPGETVGTYPINQGTLTIVEGAVNKAANYDITFQGDDFTISQRAITITVDPGQSKTYGNPDPVFTYQVTAGSLGPDDSFSGLLARDPGETVGTYPINQGTLTIVEGAVDKSANYDITFQGDDFTITQRAITITVDPGQAKTYGTPDPVFTFQVTAGSLAAGDSFDGALARAAGETIGSYAINQGTLTIMEGAVDKSANYNITFQGDDFTITQRAITITVDPGQTKTYGNPDPVFTYQVTAGSLGPDDSFSGLLARDPGETIGTYPINQGTLTIVEGAVDKAANYNITFQGADFTITQRAITITVDPGQTKTYGNPDPVFTYQVTAGSLGPDDSFSGLLARDPGEIVGTYPINQGTLTIVEGALNKAANYDITFQGDDFTISQRAITITVDPGQTKIYGTADPLFTYQVTAGSLAAGDSFDGALARAAGETIGNYAIAVGTLTIVEGAVNKAANYDITFQGDDFTITQRAITITVDPGQAKTYGNPDPVFTYQVTAGSLAAGDSFDGALARAAGETIGSYAINQGTLTIVEGAVDKSANYDITFQGADFTITQREITITADPGQTKIYGEPDPTPFTWQLTAGTLATGDAFDGLLDRAIGETVGNYAIDIGTLTIVEGALDKSANYDIKFQGIDFSITPKTLDITASMGQGKIFGDPDPVLTYSASGFEFGDDLSIMTGALSRDPGEDIGDYNITLGTLSAGSNYVINFTSAIFTIAPTALYINATAGQSKIYGQTDPVFTFTASGFEGGDDETILTGALSRVAGENVGLYPITLGDLDAGSNYTIIFTSANFEITPKTLTIQANPGQNKIYGDADPVFTFTASGFEFSDDISVITGALIRTAGEDVGFYSILIGSLSAGSNYTIDFTSSDFEILHRDITVTVDTGQTKIYGDADPVPFTYQITHGDLAFADEIVGLLVRDGGEIVGSYPINKGTLSIENGSGVNVEANYNLSIVSNLFTITPRPIEITADDLSKKCGEPDPVLSYQITSGNLVFADSFSGDLIRIAGEENGIYPILQGTLTAGGNYTITFLEGSLTISVNDDPIIAVPQNDTICFNEAAVFDIDVSANPLFPGAGWYYDVEIIYPEDVNGDHGTEGTTNNLLKLSSTGLNAFTDNLQNSGLVFRIVRYTFTPYVLLPGDLSCGYGDPVVIDIVINPQPILSPVPISTIECDSVTTSIKLESPNTFSSGTIRFDFSATPSGSPGDITGFTASGSNLSLNHIIEDELVNHTDIPQTVSYQITPLSPIGCADGPTETVVITVNPTPRIFPVPLDAVQCDSTLTNIKLESPSEFFPPILDISFKYTSVTSGNPGDVEGATPSASGLPLDHVISDFLINHTDIPQTVTYTIVPVSPLGCNDGPSHSVTVTIDPTPRIFPVPSDTIQCNNAAVSIKFESPSSFDSGIIKFQFTAEASGSPGDVTGFTPSDNNLPAGHVINDVLINNTDQLQIVTYTIVPVSPVPECNNGPAELVTVFINPTPTINISVPHHELCDEEEVTVSITTNTLSPGTVRYQLTTDFTSGALSNLPAEGSYDINDLTVSAINNTNQVQTLRLTFTPFIEDYVPGQNCLGGIPQSIDLLINPQPRIEVSASDTLCFDEGTTFDVSTVTPSINTTGTWVYDLVVTPSDPGVTGFTPTENDRTTPNFTDLLVNNTNTVQTVTYQFIPKILDPRTGLAYCEDGIDTTITIWINPQPRIEVSASDTLCFDEGTTFDISTVTPSINTTGTWVYDLVVTPSDPGVTGFTPTENDRTSLNFTDLLVNNTNTVQTVTYQFIPKILDPRTGLAYCEDGIDTTITIWINPQPRIAVSASDTLCFDEGTTFDISTVTPSINTTGTWVYDLVVTPSDPGVTGFTPTENDRTTLNFTDLLVNTTNTVQTVTYQFIPKILDPRTGLAYCEDGIDTTITIWINPQPRIEVSASDTLCFDEGTTFDISTVTPSINTTGTWVYDLVVTPSDPGVTGFTPTENDRTTLNFTDLLVNNTNTVQTVTYQFIPKILDPRTGLAYCEDGIDTTITIWINPQPRIAVSASDTLCFDEGTTFDISTVTPSINTTGTWVYDLVVTPSDPGVTGFTPTENDRTTLNFTDLLVNNTNTVQTVTYQFIPKILDPRTGLAYCEDGIDTTITIWINPQPRIEVSASDTLCFDEGTTFDVSTTNTTTGTWVYDLVVIPSDPGVTGFTPTENDRTTLNFTDLLVNNTNTVQTVTYQFIPKILDPRTGLAYCEDGIDTTITIWINPQPRIAVSASDTLCFDEGTTFDISTVTPSINTTGTWVYDLVVTPSDPGVTGFTPTENDRTTLNFTDLLVNNTNTVQTVTYQFIPKILDPRTGLAYCEDGIDTTITIWINPQPRIEVSASDTLCFDEGTTFDISTVTPSINTTGTWVYDLVVTPSDPGVTGFTPTENDRTTLNFTDLLVNATNTVQTVTYQFIPKILDPRTGLAYCEDGIDTTITIWINPQPRIAVSASDTLCFDEGTTFDVSTVTPSINYNRHLGL